MRFSVPSQPQRAPRQWRIGRHLPVPVLEVDDDGKSDAGVVRPPENGARNDRRPGIKVLVHAIGPFGGHRSSASAMRSPLGVISVIGLILISTKVTWSRL